MSPSGAVWDPALADALGTRSAIYINFESEPPPAPVISADGVTYLIGVADWGPVDEVAHIRSPREADLYLGDRQSDVRTSVLQALRRGVAEVSFYRIAAGTAADATLTLDDAVAADALRVDAKYPGTFGNDLRVEVVANVADPTDFDLVVRQGTRKLETFTGATNTELVASYVAKGSNYVDLTIVGAADRALAVIASTPLAGGDSGTAVAAGDYTTALDQASQATFRTLVIDSTDTAIQISASQWAADETAAGHRVIFVAGAADGLSFADKNTQVQALDSERTVYVVSGFPVAGSLVGAAEGVAEVDLPPVRAALVVGAIIAVQDYLSITNYTISDALDVDPKFSNDEYTTGLTNGMLILSMTGSRVHVESGLTTLQPASQVTPKSADWRKIRYVSIQDEFVQRTNAELDEHYRGKVENDARGRDEAKRIVQVVLNGMVRDRLIQPGDEDLDIPVPVAFFDPRYESDSDRVFLGVNAQFVDAVEKVFLSVVV